MMNSYNHNGFVVFKHLDKLTVVLTHTFES